MQPIPIGQDLVGRANTCVSDKNWSTLEAVAYEMAKSDAHSPWTAYFLSLAADARGDDSRAMWMIEQALKKTGGSTALFVYQRGRIWDHMREPAKAFLDIKNAVALEPALIEGELYLGQIYARDLEEAKASVAFQHVLAADATNYAALMGLGEVSLAQNHAQEAADLFVSATATRDRTLTAWLRLIFVCESVLKDPVRSLAAYKGLKSQIDTGLVREKPAFDLVTRISALETKVSSLQPKREPAQENGLKAEVKREAK